MDDADRAKKLEVHQRHIALAAQQAKAADDDGAKPVMANGVAHCIGCGVVIPPERLKVRPNAARCVNCKTIYEKRQPRGR